LKDVAAAGSATVHAVAVVLDAEGAAERTT